VVDGREECRTSLWKRNTIPNASAVLFRRDAFEKVGGADERLRLCGDWKLWVEMALLGDIAYVKEPLNYFRFHDLSVRSHLQRQGMDPLEGVSVIRSIVRGITVYSRAEKRVGSPVPRALADGYRSGIEILERSDPEEALGAIEEFSRLIAYSAVSRWEVADEWLRASRIHYRLGRPGRALLSAGRAFLVRPLVGARPIKRAVLRIAAAFRA
jgi:hypothetical protein